VIPLAKTAAQLCRSGIFRDSNGRKDRSVERLLSTKGFKLKFAADGTLQGLQAILGWQLESGASTWIVTEADQTYNSKLRLGQSVVNSLPCLLDHIRIRWDADAFASLRRKEAVLWAAISSVYYLAEFRYCIVSTVGSPGMTCNRWTPVHGFTSQCGLWPKFFGSFTIHPGPN